MIAIQNKLTTRDRLAIQKKKMQVNDHLNHHVIFYQPTK